MVVDHPDPALDRLFRALADPSRRDILRRTMTASISVTELAAAYEMSFAAVQKHVAVLEAAGLIHKTVQGRERLVRADPTQLARARAALSALEALWFDRFSQLDVVLSPPKE
jgi:DNA-binding transcriptional ArsR family regulator